MLDNLFLHFIDIFDDMFFLYNINKYIFSCSSSTTNIISKLKKSYLVYDLFESHKEVMLHSSLSAANVTDKQDPSLVIDISRLYELFLFHGYTALGLFFSKPRTSLLRLFWIKNLIHMREFYKVWWAKTFFSTWGANSSYKGQHITDQTFKDLICAVMA